MLSLVPFLLFSLICVNYCIKGSVFVFLINIQELHSHAQGQLSTCKALQELEVWGSKVHFNLSSFEDAQHRTVHIIRGLSEITQEV